MHVILIISFIPNPFEHSVRAAWWSVTVFQWFFESKSHAKHYWLVTTTQYDTTKCSHTEIRDLQCSIIKCRWKCSNGTENNSNKWRYGSHLWVLSHCSVITSLANTCLFFCPLWQLAGNLPFNVSDQFIRYKELQNIHVVDSCIFVEEWSWFDVSPHLLLKHAPFILEDPFARWYRTPDHMINSLIW